MYYTNIKTVINQQPANERGAVAFVNRQPGHIHESWACAPGFEGPPGRELPIPKTDNYSHGLWIYTLKGRCQVIDDDWKVQGRWHDGTHVTFLSIGRNEQVAVRIASDGNITVTKD